ncbi:MAG: zinc metalloprotease [Armatimonadetes bacterium]|nr:zinc metalloprotease [Armatimonadota bacterium]
MKIHQTLLVGSFAVAVGSFLAIGCAGKGSSSESLQLSADTGTGKKTVGSTDMCGSPAPSMAERNRVEKEIAALAFAPGKGGAPTVIPVYFHIVTNDDGSLGGMTDAEVAIQIDALNTGFAGTQAPGGFNTSFRFQLAGTDRTANSAWFTCIRDSADDVAMKTALRRGTAATLNLYVRDLEPGLGGWGGFPWWYAGNPVMDGPEIDYTLVGRGVDPGLAGDVFVHEVGHWMGLYHTFQDGCTTNNDYVSDTPAEAHYNVNCPTATLDTCTGKGFSGTDPWMNFMDYTNDACKYQFTSGQSRRMDQMWATYRAGK